LALVRAIATDPQARYLAADNRIDGYDLVEAAVASGRAFMVRADDDVLVLDDDRPQSRSDVLDRVAALLGVHGITAVIVASGQEGHRHLFARVVNASLRDFLRALAKKDGVDVRPSRDIRPPLAPHRSGLPVRLLEPATVTEAVAALKSRAARPALSATIQRAFLDGGTHAEDGSKMVASLALGAINAEWTFEDFYQAVFTPDTYVAAYLASKRQTRRDPDAREWLEHTWDRAETYALKNPARGRTDDGVFQQLREHARTRQWAGRTGSTDQAVYLALLDQAERAGTLTRVGFSTRDAALAAGVARGTASKALKRLTEQDLIHRAVRFGDRSTHATEWTIETQIDPPSSCPLSNEAGGSIYGPSHDLWRYGTGLGKTAGRILQALSQSPKTAAELQAELGMSMRTIRKHLRRLIDGDVVERRPGHYYAVSPTADLDALAREIGVAGRGAAQAAQYHQERKGYKEYLDRSSADICWSSPSPSTGSESQESRPHRPRRKRTRNSTS